jgi:hypothetical protein
MRSALSMLQVWDWPVCSRYTKRQWQDQPDCTVRTWQQASQQQYSTAKHLSVG